MPKRKFDLAIVGIIVLASFVVCALFLSSGTFKDMMEARRRAEEGWRVVTEGSFETLTLKRVGPEGVNAVLTSYQGGMYFDSGAVLFLRAKISIPSSEVEMGEKQALKGSYAKIVTPQGSYLLVSINKSAIDPYLCAVQIPAVQPSDTRYLDVHLIAPGCAETVVRIEKLPVTEDAVPQNGPLITEIDDGEIKVTGEAFAAHGPSSQEETGIGYRLKWSVLPSNLVWRAKLNSRSSRPFLRPNYTPQRFDSGSIEAGEARTMGLIESIPYSPEIDKIKVEASLEGFAMQEETVDFGTVKFMPDTSKRTATGYCLDFDKPISRELASGLKLTLLPLRSLKDMTTALGGESLYFRLKAEPEAKDLRIEARLLGVMLTPQQISPELNPAQNPAFSNMVMVWWKHPKSGVLPLKFSVSRLVSKRKVPIELRLPVDRSKLYKSHMTDHTLHGGSEFIQ